MAYKEIPLTRGFVTIVDESDYDWLNQWKWCHGKGYPMRRETIGYDSNGKRIQRNIPMHRLIMGEPEGMCIDHIDGNTLNNSRSNLRIVTRQQNQMNQRLRKTSKNKYKGVWHFKKYNKWMAGINFNRKRKYLGLFDSEIEAALAYNAAAIKLFGPFAKLN